MLNTQTSSPRRAAAKHDTIVSRLRHAIATGLLEPGARLPIRPRLEEQFAASRMTVQRALDLLAKDGFTQARGKLGTFVAPHPPCLSRYGLVMPYSPEHPHWSAFHAAMVRVAAELQRERDLQFPLFCDVSHAGAPGYGQLMQDVEAQRLAGLIFLNGPYSLRQSPVLTEPGLPRVAVMTPVNSPPFDRLATISFDRQDLVRQGVAKLAELGCRRAGALTLASDRDGAGERFMAAARDAGMEARSIWTQGVALDARENGAHLAQLLMSLPPDQRPDGLFIIDDNLVEHACRGLLAAGMAVGRDLHVVAHANFPMPQVDVLPLHRVGFDARQALELCLELLADQRRGEPAARRMLSVRHL